MHKDGMPKKGILGLREKSVPQKMSVQKRMPQKMSADQTVDRILREYGRKTVPEERRKREAFEVLEAAAKEKTICYKPSFFELFRIQLQYISPTFWVIQGAFLAAVVFLLERTNRMGGELCSYLWWGSLTAAWMGAAVCGELGRHLSRGMAELEQSCYFNLPQLWTMRMILSGSVDIILLGVCSGGIARSAGAPLGQVCVYLLAPFVLSNLCCLWAVTAFRGGRSRYGGLLMAFMTVLLARTLSLRPEAYEAEHFGVWVAALLFGMGLWIKQLRQCYRKIARGEILCWN